MLLDRTSIYDFTKLRLILHRKIYNGEVLNNIITDITNNNPDVKVLDVNYKSNNFTMEVSNENRIYDIRQMVCSSLCRILNENKHEINILIDMEKSKYLSQLFNEYILLGNYVHMIFNLFDYTHDGTITVRVEL